MRHRLLRRLIPAVLVCSAFWIAALRGQQQPDAASPQFVPGEILVKFRAGASTARRNAMLNAQSASLVRRFEAIDLHHLRLRTGQTVAAALAAFRASPDVLSAQPNYIRRLVASAPPNDPAWLNDSLWGLRKIMAQPAWTNFTSGDGSVVVADIDTGVNYNHPDLAANIWTNPGEAGPLANNGIDDDGDGYVDDVHGIDTVNHDSNPLDDHGHGTHTAGTLGAVGNNGIGVVGVNWNVKILACKFIGASGTGTDAGAIECFNYITWLKNHGINIRVSSNSWGAARDLNLPFPDTFKSAIDAAGDAGILNVFAAGNGDANFNGLNNDVTPFDPATFTSPSIISVAASDSADNRASFSNFGVVSVDLAAPGVSISSTYPSVSGYAELSGTSMATPHVAGAAALLFAQKPALTVAAAKALILDNVDHLGPWTGVVASGGRLNVFNAALANSGDIPPTVEITSPATNSTVSSPPPITLTANAADSDGTVSSVAFYAGGVLIGTDSTSPYSVDWSGASSGTYQVTAVATDNVGATTTSAAITVTVVAPQTLMTTQVPTTPSINTGQTWELGTRIISDVAGQITAIRFWKSPSEVGVHTGHIWNAAVSLATVTFASETASGWQQQALDVPVAMLANTPYVVSVGSGSNGYFGVTLDAFTNGLINGHLRAPAGNSALYGPPGAFPTGGTPHNYFRDILFVPNGGGSDTTPPLVSVTQPLDGATVSGLVTIAATASDDIGVSGVQFQVDGENLGNEVQTGAYTVSWDSTSKPNGPHTLTAIARDAAGHYTSASVSVTAANTASQTLMTTQLPTTQNANTGQTWELGTRIISDVAGRITAIRFWKSPSEVGVHTGHIWNAAGVSLATVTFASETASGWQQQALDVPVAMLANTPYVVSVGSGSNGYFGVTLDAFTNGLINGHLRAPAGNSAAYGPSGAFPTGGTTHNYFRDLVFVPDTSGGSGDTTPPQVTLTQPVDGATVSGLVMLAATATDDVGVAGVQFQVDSVNLGSEVQLGAYSVSWDSTSKPNGPHTLTAVARDAAGHYNSASVTVTVANAPSQTLMTTQVPATPSINSGQPWELGTRIISDVTGQVTAIRFWKSPNEAGVHTGHIWNAAGQSLATVTFTSETASGWQQQALPTPVAILANAPYVVSVNTGSNGYLAVTFNGFTSGLVNGHLQAPAGNSGFYGPPGAFPTSGVSSNYFRDLVFVPDTSGGSGDTTPPQVTLTQPVDGATVSGLVTLAATATDDVGVAGVQFQVDSVNLGSEVQLGAYSVSWDSTSKPNGPHTLTAVARDAAGHYNSASVTVTVANAPSQTLMTTQVPTTPSINSGQPWELGTRIISDVTGQVTAIRFWKSPNEAGVHTGHIWDAAGQSLATVTFASETASGWQQQALPTPVAILANAPYVVSVNTGSNGYLAVTFNGFASGLVNGHLQAPAGNSGFYGPPGVFPTSGVSYNYFRDIVFVADGSGVTSDTTPPTAAMIQPPAGSSVTGLVAMAATATDDSGVAGVQFQVDGVNLGSEVRTGDYSLVWDSSGAAQGAHTLTAVARDRANHQTAASVTVSVDRRVSSPALPPPTGRVVNVSTEPQLQSAVRNLRSDTTIVLAPGRYLLTSTLAIDGSFTNVGIRGATTNRDDVVLAGPGMAQASYGNAPSGIWTGNGVSGVTIANLTIRDFYQHPIVFNAGTQSPLVHNVHLIDAGKQFIKSNPDPAGGGVNDGIVEYSVIEYTTTAKDDYTNGVDVHTGANWIVRHNLFRNIVAPAGQLAGPAVLMWNHSRNTLTEGNTFLNCARGISYGLTSNGGTDHVGGVIRNNFFFRAGSQPGDVAIHVADSPNTQVLNNTVFVSGTYATPIEYRFAGAAGIVLTNNLLDGTIAARDGATGIERTNLSRATAALFADASSGDLHLAASAAAAIDRGTALSEVADDWDGMARPQGAGYDIGADEFDARTGR